MTELPLKTPRNSTIDMIEVEKFSAIADEWWDPKGKFRPLHKINPTRIEYIRDSIIKHFNIKIRDYKPLKGIKVLDIGCGGGLVSIPLCNMGANISGIDASENNIKTAQAYAFKQDLNIKFITSTPEELAKSAKTFDVILALEIIEHVAEPRLFIDSLAALLKPNGLVILSTINRTIKSLVLAKIGAEYILRWLPIGTHSWDKFLKPAEIDKLFIAHNLCRVDTKGINFNPIINQWYLSNQIEVNYITCYKAI